MHQCPPGCPPAPQWFKSVGQWRSLHDFNLPPSLAGSAPISTAGRHGPVVPGAGTREQLAEALSALGPALQGWVGRVLVVPLLLSAFIGVCKTLPYFYWPRQLIL
jgi:hypothetical protein